MVPFETPIDCNCQKRSKRMLVTASVALMCNLSGDLLNLTRLDAEEFQSCKRTGGFCHLPDVAGSHHE